MSIYGTSSVLKCVAAYTNKSIFSYYVCKQCDTARICLPPLLQQSIDISYPLAPQEQTCSSGFAAVAHAKKDGQTNGQTYYRVTDDTVQVASACAIVYFKYSEAV